MKFDHGILALLKEQRERTENSATSSLSEWWKYRSNGVWLTTQMWFGVVCTLKYNGMRHDSGVNGVNARGAHYRERLPTLPQYPAKVK